MRPEVESHPIPACTPFTPSSGSASTSGSSHSEELWGAGRWQETTRSCKPVSHSSETKLTRRKWTLQGRKQISKHYLNMQKKKLQDKMTDKEDRE